MALLLDTHAWLWWISDPRQLSSSARTEIDQAVDSDSITISAISCWEVALLVRKQRLRLAFDVDRWMSKTLALPFVRLIPVDPQIALRAVDLPGSFHADPADRMIVATALARRYRLVTKDQKILDYPHVETVW